MMLCCAAAWAAIGGQALAQTTRTWTGTTSNDVRTSTNWNPNALPANGDSLVWNGTQAGNLGLLVSNGGLGGADGVSVRFTGAQTGNVVFSSTSAVVFRIATGTSFIVDSGAGAITIGGTAGNSVSLRLGGTAATGSRDYTIVNNSANILWITGSSGIAAGAGSASNRLFFQGTGNTTIDGIINSTLTNGVVKEGTGTLTLNNANSQNGTTLSAGTIRIGNNRGLGLTTGALAVNAGTLDLNGFSPTVGLLSGSAGGVITTANTSGTAVLTSSGTLGSSTYAGSIQNNGSGVVALTKSGDALLALTGTNTFTGATTILAGILSINGTTALAGTSGVTITGGAGLSYTGSTAATFAKNVTVTAGSGTGTIQNSGGATLTLSGNLSKDNSVLRLTGGAFDVTGLITGTTVGASDLIVDAAAVTLSNANTYNGPTYVYNSGTLSLGVDNAIPTASVVYLGNATTRGTLATGTFSDSISQLVFSGSGGTLSLSGNKTAAAQLATNGSLTLGGNADLVLTSAGTSAGLYRLISFTSSSGSFASISGTSVAYQVITTSTSIDYQQRAVLGAVTVTSPTVSIITGGSAAFTYTVANSALSGGASLGVTGAGVSNVVGSSSGTAAAAGTSGAISGLVFTGTSVGANQQGTFTVNAPTAFGATSATGTVSVNVLNHSNAAFSLAGGNNQTIITGGSLSAVTFGLTNAGTGRSALDVSTLSNLSGTSGVAAVASNGSATYTATGFNTTAVGQNKTLSVSLQAGDQQSLSGASALASYSGTATYTVLGHSLASFAATDSASKTLDLGTFDNLQSAWWADGSGAQQYSLFNIAADGFTNNQTAGLALYDWAYVSGNDVFSLGLSAFGNLAAGNSNTFFADALSPASLTRGTYRGVYQLRFRDQQNLSGAANTRNLTLTLEMVVVPEPNGFVLAGIGGAVAAWLCRRKRR